MRKQTFPCDYDVLARFPSARAYARGEGWITYLAEERGLPYLIVDSRAIADSYAVGDPILDDLVTVIAFEDEVERAGYLVERDRRAEAYRETVQTPVD